MARKMEYACNYFVEQGSQGTDTKRIFILLVLMLSARAHCQRKLHIPCIADTELEKKLKRQAYGRKSNKHFRR